MLVLVNQMSRFARGYMKLSICEEMLNRSLGMVTGVELSWKISGIRRSCVFIARKCHSYAMRFGNYEARSCVLLLLGINGGFVGDDMADVDDHDQVL